MQLQAALEIAYSGFLKAVLATKEGKAAVTVLETPWLVGLDVKYEDAEEVLKKGDYFISSESSEKLVFVTLSEFSAFPVCFLGNIFLHAFRNCKRTKLES